MPKCELVGPDFLDRAAVVARATVDVDATPAQVWQVLNDTARWPEWFDGMNEARVTSAEWDGIGSSRYVKIGPLKVHEQVVLWEPEQRWGFAATEIGWTAYIAKRLLETLDIEPAGTGSRITYTGAIDPPLHTRPFGWLLRKQLGKAWETNLRNIDGQVIAS